METSVCQRWRDRRGSYRPAGEPIVTAHYEVALSTQARLLKPFVVRHHYSGSAPSMVRGFALYHRLGTLAGVAIFSTVARQFCDIPGEPGSSLALGRFVLLDDVAANGESWFLGRCFEQLRALGYVGVVSYADPQARTTAAGRVVFAGHIGNIYQAHNGIYTGRTKRETKWLLPDGTLFESRAVNKIKSGDRGHRYATALLVNSGAAPLRPSDNPAEWARLWRSRLGRPLIHDGNYRYLWALDRRVRKHLPKGERYPKFDLQTPRSWCWR